MKDLWVALSFSLFGWHHFRVRFDYKNHDGRVVLSYSSTIGVREIKLIDDHRFVKRAKGPITNVKGIPRRMLCNGVIAMEPICYLGRWR